MDFDYMTLYKKLLDFWKQHDGNGFETKDLRVYFSADELAAILFDNEFYNYNYKVINLFKEKVGYKRDGLFSSEEADRLYPEYGNERFIIRYCSDEFLLSLVDDEEYNLTQTAISYIDSDDVLVEAFKRLKTASLKSHAVSKINDINLKLKLMKKLPSEEQTSVILSFDDEYLVEKYISLFRGDKGDLIRSFDSDEKKIRYFKKYFAVLSSDEKADIIISLDDDEKVMYYLKYVGDYAKGEVITRRFSNKPEYIDKILPTIKNKRVIADLLRYHSIDEKYVEQYIGVVTDQEALEEIISRLDNHDLVVKYFPRLTYKRKLEKVKDIYEPELKFQLLKYINKHKDVISVIEHCEAFPQYNDEYEYLMDLYSKVYQVDKQRLITLAKNISLSVLKYIDNDNIRKILNAKEDEFVLLIRMFNKDDLKMDKSSMNDILNTLLQRKFRISSPDVVLIFPLTLNAIDSKDRETIVSNIDKLNEVVNLEEEIKEYGWTKDSFVDALLNKDESAIDFLHLLTAKYIRNERSVFVQENLGNALRNSTHAFCDKNDLMRFAIMEFPVEVVIDLFFYPVYRNDRKVFTDEEVNFLENSEVIKNIILYKKDPKAFGPMTDEIKKNLKLFNSVFDKRYTSVRYEAYPGYNGKMNVEYKDIDEEFLVSILMYLDMDKLRINFLKDPAIIERFMKFWKQYKIGGWGNTFNGVLSSSGMVVDAEIVANFIQYFGLSYEQLEEKMEKKEISSISLTALLDLAACYSTESKKYSLLFGDEDFKFIASNPGPNSSTWSKEKRIERAVDLVRVIRDRDYVTVPPVDKDFELPNGKMMNVVVGNFSNMMNLTYGERTGACMRIGGAGKSLFDFCLEDDNGFHIRFVNPRTGKFVSRVSGFRNGNTVFLNELRYSEDSEYTNKDVVEACKLVARELVENSKESELPIDNVVITPYYSMEQSGMLARNIGISDPQKGMKKFYTDVSASSIILATSGPNNTLVAPQLGVKGVPKYHVLRDKKKVLYNREAANYVAHIHTLDQVLGGTNVDSVDVQINEDIIVCLAGEDWYVTIDKQGNIGRYIMNNSNSKNDAINEVQAALAYLRENLNKEMQIANNVLGM
jgi:hypothetical protein